MQIRNDPVLLLPHEAACGRVGCGSPDDNSDRALFQKILGGISENVAMPENREENTGDHNLQGRSLVRLNSIHQ